ncbi:MAG: hypothetical protein JO317_00280 [Verrucomicrobiae bacterium]|nr:hypothetical protein [Verrucomicrobiae bacterium]
MTVATDPRIFRYRIDALGAIVWVNPEWLDFARENGAEHLANPPVVGQPLELHIAGESTRHVYELILKKVRGEERPIKFRYRCDSPDKRRFMEMTVTPLRDDDVEFASRILKIEDRDPVAFLDPDRPAEGDFVKVCSWCRKVQVGDGWLEVEDAVRVLRLMERHILPPISHGICEGCLRSIQFDAF